MRRTGMDKAREILRQHFEVGLSQREIADSVKVSLGTVSGILAKARAAGISYPVKLNNKELGSILYPPVEKDGNQKYAEPDMEYVHREMQKKGVTLTLLWEEYKTEHPDGLMFTQFCTRYTSLQESGTRPPYFHALPIALYARATSDEQSKMFSCVRPA